MESAAFGEGLLTLEQTLSHIGTWVLFLPLHVSSGWGMQGRPFALLPDFLKTILVF